MADPTLGPDGRSRAEVSSGERPAADILGSDAGGPYLVRRRDHGEHVAAAVARLEPGVPESQAEDWPLGPIVLGPAQQAADILTRALSVEEVQRLATGLAEMVRVLATVTGRA